MISSGTTPRHIIPISTPSNLVRLGDGLVPISTQRPHTAPAHAGQGACSGLAATLQLVSSEPRRAIGGQTQNPQNLPPICARPILSRAFVHEPGRDLILGPVGPDGRRSGAASPCRGFSLLPPHVRLQIFSTAATSPLALRLTPTTPAGCIPRRRAVRHPPSPSHTPSVTRQAVRSSGLLRFTCSRSC